jgi:histone chaperone ASF1
MVYVGAADSSEHDLTLDSIMVGPVPVGVNKFVFAVSDFLCVINKIYSL